MFETIVSWYAPHRCLSCDAENALLCDSCAHLLVPVAARCYRCRALSSQSQTCVTCRRASSLWRVQAVTSYDGVAKELVGRLKFSGARAVANELASHMHESLDLPDCLLVHLPTATYRQRLRGYDQSALITKALAKQADLEYLPCLLRVGQHRQVGSTRLERLAQTKDSFFVRDGRAVAGRHIVLIDDVMTTGASLESAAAVLKKAGAARVEAVVFARA